MKRTTLWMALLLIGALFLTSCKKDEDNPVTPNNNPPAHASGAYVGLVAGTTENGVLTLNIASSKVTPSFVLAVVNVSGTLKIGSNTITLTGTYNTDNDSLHVSGGGYTFHGTYSAGVLQGEYSGPNGSGGFSTQSSSGTEPVKVYFGRAVSTVRQNTTVTLNIAVKGSTLVGVAFPDGDAVAFSGTVSGKSIALKIQVSANLTANLGSGTFNDNFTAASGTYSTAAFDNTDPDMGTWSVTIAQ